MDQITQYSEMTDIAVRSRYDGRMSSLLSRKDNEGYYEQRPFGKALKQLRKRRGLTQTDVAVHVGVAGPSTVAGWERRFAPLDDDYMMERLAATLGVDVDDLAAGIVRPEPVAALAFDDAIEGLAQAHLSGESLRLALTMWKAARMLPDEDMVALARIVEAMAALEREREATQPTQD